MKIAFWFYNGEDYGLTIKNVGEENSIGTYGVYYENYKTKQFDARYYFEDCSLETKSFDNELEDRCWCEERVLKEGIVVLTEAQMNLL